MTKAPPIGISEACSRCTDHDEISGLELGAATRLSAGSPG